ncbi:MAG: GNAT family N-acetyltransferase [Candidatus Fimenecus sp.]
MRIRFAKEKDCERIYDLSKEIAEFHHNLRPDLFNNTPKYSIKEIMKIINEKDNVILVAADYSDNVIGYCINLKKENGGHSFIYIDDICIDESYRRQGIAERLIVETKKVAKKNGITTIELHAFCDNEGAVKFYESIGMKKRYITMEYINKQN